MAGVGAGRGRLRAPLAGVAGNVAQSGTPAELLESLSAPKGALVALDRGVATDDRVGCCGAPTPP